MQQLKKSLKKGHWAVFITIDGKDYLLGQVIVTVDGKINNYISEWKGEKLKSAISQLYELNKKGNACSVIAYY